MPQFSVFLYAINGLPLSVNLYSKSPLEHKPNRQIDPALRMHPVKGKGLPKYNDFMLQHKCLVGTVKVFLQSFVSMAVIPLNGGGKWPTG